MKRSFFAAAATLALVAPLALSTASAQEYRDRRGEQSQQYDNRDRDRAPDARSNDGRGDDRRYQDRRYEGRRYGDASRHDRRDRWRENYRGARSDDSQHNGYYRQGRWHYGPPPQQYRDVTLGYRPWARGQRLGYYQGRYQEVDYRQNNLRQPPRGYHWVRNDGGDLLLAAIVGGLITQVIINNGR
ncbi:MAG: RcnB family protein [Alphaproteobacteria bacterium]|nr:RcnB family protein [Alphaproteobacteria bacterium]